MASSASNTSVRPGQSSNEDMSSSASSSTPPVTSPDVLDRECQQCLSFLASALDRKGRPQTLLRALGVLSNNKEGDTSAWYAPTDDGRGVVINLERQQAVSMVVEEGSTVSIESTDVKVRNMQQHTNITNDSGISLRRRLTNAATMIVGGMRGGGGENGAGSDVLTTSPALQSNDVTDAQNESLVTTITIECQKCGSDTRAEAGARAYVRGPVPLSIILCSNRLSSQREVDEVLVHELVHVYGKLQLIEYVATRSLPEPISSAHFHLVNDFYSNQRCTLETNGLARLQTTRIFRSTGCTRGGMQEQPHLIHSKYVLKG